ncbi:MAG: hypothetical protein ACREEM_05490 [Blastocatellia bacterium]
MQVTPISLCMPYISFTPVFLIFTGQVMLGEMPATEKLIGVAMIFIGSLAMHRLRQTRGHHSGRAARLAGLQGKEHR